jgi:hypothetical protein
VMAAPMLQVCVRRAGIRASDPEPADIEAAAPAPGA